MNPTSEQIKHYAKQLKIPNFSDYEEILRKSEPSPTFTAKEVRNRL